MAKKTEEELLVEKLSKARAAETIRVIKRAAKDLTRWNYLSESFSTFLSGAKTSERVELDKLKEKQTAAYNELHLQYKESIRELEGIVHQQQSEAHKLVQPTVDTARLFLYLVVPADMIWLTNMLRHG